jgi:hypothetical protein
VLANLLPGVRELRAPLAAGYLWFVASWIALADRFPSEKEAEGVTRALYRLEDITSAIGLAVAISFAAYLGGALSEALFARVFPVLERALVKVLGKKLFLRGETEFDLFRETLLLVSRRGERALRTLAARILDELRPTDDVLAAEVEVFHRYRTVNEALRRAREVLTPDAERAQAPEEDVRLTTLVGAVLAELQLVETRLIGEQTELYSTADRLGAEAEFRDAVTPPLVGLVVVLAFESSPAWLIGLIPIAMLYWQGVRRRQAHNDLLADALLLGRVEAPIVERLRYRMEDGLRGRVVLPR